MNYLVVGQFSSHWEKSQRDRFRAPARHFFWEELYLFKICADQVIHRCVLEDEFESILSMYHGEGCGGHFSGKKITTKVLQSGFYWPTVFRDAQEFYGRCV